MNKPQKPLMLAYLLFLVICAICYVVGNIVSTDFMAWNQIIVGATVASYFFSLSSLYVINISQEETALSLYLEQSVLYSKITAMDNCTSEQAGNADVCGDTLVNEIKRNENAINKARKNISIYNCVSFWGNVGGYLSFFCILSFPDVFNHFEKSQEWYTLLAFIAVTFSEYFKSTKMVYYNNLCTKVKDNIRKVTALLEEKENG